MKFPSPSETRRKPTRRSPLRADARARPTIPGVAQGRRLGTTATAVTRIPCLLAIEIDASVIGMTTDPCDRPHPGLRFGASGHGTGAATGSMRGTAADQGLLLVATAVRLRVETTQKMGWTSAVGCLMKYPISRSLCSTRVCLGMSTLNKIPGRLVEDSC